jgi:hypothetical protein
MAGRTGRRHRQRRDQHREFGKNRKKYLRFNNVLSGNPVGSLSNLIFNSYNNVIYY